MKKYVTLLLLMLSMSNVFSQHYETLNVVEIQYGQTLNYCRNNDLLGVIVYGEQNCNPEWQGWHINSQPTIYGDSIVLNSNIDTYQCLYEGCEYDVSFTVYFKSSYTNQNPFAEPVIWKRHGDSITLVAGTEYYFWEHGITGTWSTGENGWEITVTEPGTYSVTLTDDCGSATYSVEVRNNVEIDLATCDLESNLNLVIWPTTPAQAEYVDHVIVKRDGMEVGTANYSDGFFLDNIGSDLAQRTYTLIAVATDGSQCPIVSYPKETIHMAYLTGVNNTIEVNWNIPTGYDLLGYNICEWIPDGKDGELTVIDFVGAGVTSYTCTENQFNNGHVVVQGVENGRTESRLLSNRSEEGIVGIGEHLKQNFKIYPNPSSGAFTVEGASTLTIYNTLGQIIATSHSEDGAHTFSLAPGLYFVKSGEGIVKKVIVQ